MPTSCSGWNRPKYWRMPNSASAAAGSRRSRKAPSWRAAGRARLQPTSAAAPIHRSISPSRVCSGWAVVHRLSVASASRGRSARSAGRRQRSARRTVSTVRSRQTRKTSDARASHSLASSLGRRNTSLPSSERRNGGTRTTSQTASTPRRKGTDGRSVGWTGGRADRREAATGGEYINNRDGRPHHDRLAPPRHRPAARPERPVQPHVGADRRPGLPALSGDRHAGGLGGDRRHRVRGLPAQLPPRHPGAGAHPLRRRPQYLARRVPPRPLAGDRPRHRGRGRSPRSEEHTSELQSHLNLVCRLLLEHPHPRRGHQRAAHHVTGAESQSFLFFYNDTPTTEIYTLSLHDALPIWSFT